MKKLTLITALATIATQLVSHSQMAWTDGGLDGVWSNASNWTGGVVPTTTSAVIFDSGSFPDPDPITHIITVNAGAPTIIGSLTSQASTAYALSLVSGGTDTLQVNGALTNLGVNVVNIDLEYTFGSNTLSGPFAFSSIVNTGVQNVSVTGATVFSNSVYLTLTDSATYGRYSLNAGASANLSGSSIKFAAGSSYTGNATDVFQLFNIASGSWSGVTGSTLDVTSLPTLTGGLTWDTSSFTTNGSISVVPEPATWAMFATGLTTLMVFRPRRRRS